MATGVLRTFFAIDIGDAARRAAQAVAERLAAEPGGDAVRWSRPEAYHVTLRFLGPTPEDRVGAIAAAVRDATRDVAPFALRLGAVHGFPNPRRARIVVLDLDSDGEAGARSEPQASEIHRVDPIRALAVRVEAAVAGAGFAPEERAFHPHVTLGRIQDRARTLRLDAALGPADPAPFRVEEIVFYQSALAPGGSQYTPLERIPLGVD